MNHQKMTVLDLIGGVLNRYLSDRPVDAAYESYAKSPALSPVSGVEASVRGTPLCPLHRVESEDQ